MPAPPDPPPAPRFAPIVDLGSGAVVAYELHAPRGLAPGAQADAAARAVAGLAPAARAHRFHLRLPAPPGPEALRALLAGLRRPGAAGASAWIVSFGGRSADAGEALRTLLDEGVEGAVEGLGGPATSLLDVAAFGPRHAWLDPALTRDLHDDPYRGQLVRALAELSRAVGLRLTAPGVACWEALEALMAAGVRQAAGPLFGAPAAAPEPLAHEVRARLACHGAGSRAGTSLHAREDAAGALVRAVPTVDPDTTTVEALGERLRARAELDHVVLVRAEVPVGLVTRQAFDRHTAGPFGYSLHQRKSVAAVANPSPLVVRHDVPTTTLATLAMARAAAELYDPVVVVDAHGRLVGSITMRHLVERSVELQVEAAQGASPLTGLPGNVAIERWIASSFSGPEAAIVYADLDRFKEFNDRYGFLVGDEMLRVAARVLVRALGEGDPPGLVGHVGGDDFVVVLPEGAAVEALVRCGEAFDAARLALFTDEDVARGYFVSKDRRGEETRVPLVTLSLAVIERAQLGDGVHPALLSQIAASLKAKVKQQNATRGASGHLFERRHHAREGSEAPTSAAPPRPSWHPGE